MKCLNCNQENNPNASFCERCGTKLINNENNNYNFNPSNDQAITNNNNNYNNFDGYNNYNNNYNNGYNNNQSNNQTKSKKTGWIIAGIIAAIITVIVIINPDSNSSSYTVDDKTKFQNYLTKIGFTKQDSTTYTYYKDGYTYTIDFYENIFSQEKGTSTYNEYHYKKDIFGAAIATNSLKVIATYDFVTYDYNCKTEPTTYQTYTCNYMESTITSLAETCRKTFYTLISGAEVSVSNL